MPDSGPELHDPAESIAYLKSAQYNNDYYKNSPYAITERSNGRKKELDWENNKEMRIGTSKKKQKELLQRLAVIPKYSHEYSFQDKYDKERNMESNYPLRKLASSSSLINDRKVFSSSKNWADTNPFA